MVRRDWRRARDDDRMAAAAREARLAALDAEARESIDRLSEPLVAEPLDPGVEPLAAPISEPTTEELEFLGRLAEMTAGRTLTVSVHQAPERMVRITCGQGVYRVVVHGVAVRHLNALEVLGIKADVAGRISGSWTSLALQRDPMFPLRLLRAVFDDSEIEGLEIFG